MRIINDEIYQFLFRTSVIEADRIAIKFRGSETEIKNRSVELFLLIFEAKLKRFRKYLNN